MQIRRAPRLTASGIFSALFLASGFAGLVHETIWARYLGILLGHSAYGQILTITVYMGGIGLGSYFAARLLKRLRSPLLAYALVEAGISAGGFVFHSEFVTARAFILDSGILFGKSDFLASSILVVLGIALTLPWAFLIGMTYPLATSGLIRLKKDDGNDSIARLYFANSFGAAVGALTNSFILIPAIGTPGALMVAGAINSIVALIAWQTSHAIEKKEPNVAMSDTDHKSPSPSPIFSAQSSWLLFASLVTGLSSFLYEIGWIRYLALLLGSSTHAFDMMVSAFILGLAGGAITVHRSQWKDLKSKLVFAQLAMAGFATLGVVAYQIPFQFTNFLPLVLEHNDSAYLIIEIIKYVLCTAIMVPASWFAGMTLPLITQILVAEGGESHTGRVYAWNTFGAIIGAMIGGLILMPALGFLRLIGVGAIIDIGLAFALILVLKNTKIIRNITISAVVLILLSVVFVRTEDSALICAGSFQGHRVYLPQDTMNRIDGRTATISLFRNATQIGILTNGKPDASTFRGKAPYTGDELTQAFLAWIPRSFLKTDFNAAIIGMGSGITASKILADTLCKSLDLIEIEPAVHKLAEAFQPTNTLVYTSPKAKLHFMDARIFFARKSQKFDLIVSEPSNPWVSGVSSLFTEEFYTEAQSHLTQRGILIQWLHAYQSNDKIILSIINAMQNSFPYVRLLNVPGVTDFYIIASLQELPPSRKIHFSPSDSAFFCDQQISASAFPENLMTLSQNSLHFLSNQIEANSEYYPILDVLAERAFYANTKSSFIESSGSGIISIEQVVTKSQTPISSPGRQEILGRSYTDTVFIPTIQAAFAYHGAEETNMRKYFYSTFRSTVPIGAWQRPAIDSLLMTLYHEQVPPTNNYPAWNLFKWQYEILHGLWKSADLRLLSLAKSQLQTFRIIDLRDIYAYAVWRGNYTLALALRSQISNAYPSSDVSPDFLILDSFLAEEEAHQAK